MSKTPATAPRVYREDVQQFIAQMLDKANPDDTTSHISIQVDYVLAQFPELTPADALAAILHEKLERWFGPAKGQASPPKVGHTPKASRNSHSRLKV